MSIYKPESGNGTMHDMQKYNCAKTCTQLKLLIESMVIRYKDIMLANLFVSKLLVFEFLNLRVRAIEHSNRTLGTKLT